MNISGLIAGLLGYKCCSYGSRITVFSLHNLFYLDLDYMHMIEMKELGLNFNTSALLFHSQIKRLRMGY